jgi:CubicO group peptidase (beta-lactamase class C family)
VVILWRGRLLAERYWAPPRDLVSSQPDLFKQLTFYSTTAEGWPREDVASTQKSVTSFLVGIAAEKGLVDIERPVSAYLGEGWSKASPAQEGQITVRHLLSMASGLDEQLVYEESAGTYWRYNTPAYSRLGPVLEKASGHDLNALTRAWLTEPAGMTDSGWQERPRELIPPHANPIGFVTTPRDLARFGLLMLNRGVWNGTAVLGDPSWIESSFSPSQKANPAYGYLWWLNGSDSLRRGRGRTEPVAGPLIPGAPADMVAAMGALDRRLYVVPSTSLIVTRLGGPAGRDFDRELWELLMKAVPELP